ncbi:thiamine phosphate synthase [Cutibacterium sp.]|uniref:thiamine phosphate synthase n=1 Tax=Cutibacterium sp. TaxID=1912221 RepID=UPI0026DCCC2E|nr:thiamine phosphate synthase [Cutibacterium sp.]MDO4412630.1 thiamine phosphate synthase [Cutibacterium sp.]
MTPDLRCYVVTSGTERRTVQTAALAAGAGAGIIQVRAKTLTTRDLLSLVLQVGEAVRRSNPETRVVVDDRADVAWAAMRARGNVHGVHLGVQDLPVRDARALLGPEAIVGYTTGTLDLVRSAEPFADALDYLGAGPFRPTPTKDSGRPPLGIEGYPALVQASSLPIVAIGDVQVDDVAALAGSGIAGVAMVRAVMGAEDPAAVVSKVIAAFDRER